MLVSIFGVVVATLVFVLAAPTQPDREMIDHALFTLATDEMRSGESYYQAMEDAFAVVYGPDRAELTETVRGFRLPTTFLIWRLLPGDRAVWLLFAALAGLSGVLAAQLARVPPLGILVTIYLLSLGMLYLNGVWTAQFATIELWAVPAMLGAVLAVSRERWWIAAGLALLAFAIRETAAPMLVVGAGLALMGRVPKRPWFLGLVLAIGLYVVHASLAAPFIEPGVAAALPSRGEIPGSMARILGMGLPGGVIVGPVLWALSLRRVFRMSGHRFLMSSYLWLPLSGLLLERHYWGIIVVPLTLIWGLDEAVEVSSTFRQRPRRGQTRFVP